MPPLGLCSVGAGLVGSSGAALALRGGGAAVMWHRGGVDAEDRPLRPPYVTLRPGWGQSYRSCQLPAAEQRARCWREVFRFRGGFAARSSWRCRSSWDAEARVEHTGHLCGSRLLCSFPCCPWLGVSCSTGRTGVAVAMAGICGVACALLNCRSHFDVPYGFSPFLFYFFHPSR